LLNKDANGSFSSFSKEIPKLRRSNLRPHTKATLPVWRAVFVAKRPEQKATFLHLYPMSTLLSGNLKNLLSSVIHNCGVIVDP
jgi:hypothetical protein